jgi:serine/threonine protein kinase/Tol biopolymer transport system component
LLPATLGHYRIVRPIGTGGMGEVFLADDGKLGRKVALKVLAHALAADPERRGRFEREARAVAALNHPNIITIYSVEDLDGVLFLTMELVEGKTLTELIPPHGMSLEQLLHVGIPLADAVGAAHQRGITHRDLKPANVMVTDEGRVKVLDFGLAKLHEESPVGGLSVTVTKEQLTSEGRIVGTVAYMSPEQAQGKAVDARSDVFSLGVLLFEMATGEKPFKGDTNMSLLSAIIKDTPSSVTDLRQDLPRDVGRILRRCLAKDPEERYQTAKDLRNDLRLLKEDLDTGVAERAQPSSHISQSTVLPSTVSRMPSAARLAVAAAAVLAIAVAGGWWYARRPATTSAPAFANITMRRLTNTGTASLAAISPDGRYVVHVDGDFDKPSLWMRQASTASSVQIVPPMAGAYAGLAFSPDGEAVLYVFGPEGGVLSLFQIPVLGGPPRKLVQDINTAPAFSPDGKRMAFIRGMADGGQVIVLANADGTNERRLASRPESDAYAQTRVAWSPDGTEIAAFAGEMPKQRSRIVLVNVESGREQAFGDGRFDSGGQLLWLADGSALVFDAIEQYGGRWNMNSQLWSIAYPAGTLRRITPDLASYAILDATARGRTLVAVRDEVRAGLWVAPDGDTARARPITSSSNGREGATGIDWTSDGRIVYSSTTQGSWDIWIANSDGSQARPLTSDPALETQPRVVPDGTGIVFTSRASGASDVMVRRIDLDGSNPRQIATGGAIHRGYVQPIGDHLYFRALEKGWPVAFRVPLGGGPREPLFPDPTRLPPRFFLTSVSPDERWALGTYTDPQSSGMAIVPLDGPGPVRRFPYSYTPGHGFGSGWAPGGHAIEDLVFRDKAANLWRFPLDGSMPRPVTTFTSDQIMNYRWSRDGKMLAMSRGTESADVVLITSEETDRKVERSH